MQQRTPQFVFDEEASVRRRGWTENLQFYTGVGYLAGGSSVALFERHRRTTAQPRCTADEWIERTCPSHPWAAVAGGSVGVANGVYNYATVKPEIPLDTLKLKANRLLNASGKPSWIGWGTRVRSSVVPSLLATLSTEHGARSTLLQNPGSSLDGRAARDPDGLFTHAARTA